MISQVWLILVVDTYFSQATVDDVNKGFTNHKVTRFPLCHYGDANAMTFRILNHRTFPYLCSEMATVGEGLHLKCLKMQKKFFNVYFAVPDIVFFIQLRRIKATTNTHRELPSIGMGHSADEFFVALDQDSAQGKTLPNWCVTRSMHLWHSW